MKISAEVLADSINKVTGDRLTTLKIVCPKFILAEFNTHRVLSRNFSSSRAVPAKKMRAKVIFDPVIPVSFGRNQSGMQAKEELTGWRRSLAMKTWLWARYPACVFHFVGEKIGLHKQLLNRIIEPWLWAEGIISSTTWENLFVLRDHPDAQPEFQALACAMREAIAASVPNKLPPGAWHIPFAPDHGQMEIVKKISAARCARVSYFLRSGVESDVKADVKLCDRLAGSNPKHLSPFEHQAMALEESVQSGNFRGWMQYRKELENNA
jgi:hypothetical protein